MLVGRAAGLGAVDERLRAAGAELRSATGYTLRITPEDLLWLARAVQFEGGSTAATIWTYAQRAALYEVPSLAGLVRAHSQPVNPIWASMDAEGCQRAPSRCTPEQLATRARAASIPWSELSPLVRAKVIAWARAELPNPVPRATDFAAPEVSRAFLQRHPGSYVVLRAGNWYIAEAESARWPKAFVKVVQGGRVSSESALPSWTKGALWGAAAAALAGAGWWAWRHVR